MYFNNYRWGAPWSTPATYYDDDGAARCKAYFSKLFAGLQKARCDVFRLHMDPAWTNDPSDTYIYPGSAGQTEDTKGEADIRKFNPERLKHFLHTLYFPLAKEAMNHGMYVVIRPPGVCPHKLRVDDYYQNYLLKVWDIVTQNDSVRKYAGQISIELANEPVILKNAQGQDDAAALHDYFQPVVDRIRQNGFTGIIWAPGTGWQSNYTDYVSYPIEGTDIGYAVHDYTGWYGCSDSHSDPQSKISQFHKQVPVVEHGQQVLPLSGAKPSKPAWTTSVTSP